MRNLNVLSWVQIAQQTRELACCDMQIEGFDVRAAVTLLDEELREAVLGTASGALGECAVRQCCMRL